MNRGYEIYIPFTRQYLINSFRNYSIFLNNVKENLKELETINNFLILVRNYLIGHCFKRIKNIREVKSDHHIKASDYGFCLIGSYFLKDDIELLFSADMFISKELIRGKINQVLNYDNMVYSFLKNGPGNQEYGSIKPLNPKDFCEGFIWNWS